ncbi:MAG: hypothetical protein ABJF11_14135 [Reichenbachiella sp.]|uniref:hypothetical protein n=1 Tax=Reichenbachiella sp. TaxID=2184521 RepID=UPI003263D542
MNTYYSKLICISLLLISFYAQAQLKVNMVSTRTYDNVKLLFGNPDYRFNEYTNWDIVNYDTAGRVLTTKKCVPVQGTRRKCEVVKYTYDTLGRWTITDYLNETMNADNILLVTQRQLKRRYNGLDSLNYVQWDYDVNGALTEKVISVYVGFSRIRTKSFYSNQGLLKLLVTTTHDPSNRPIKQVHFDGTKNILIIDWEYLNSDQLEIKRTKDLLISSEYTRIDSIHYLNDARFSFQKYYKLTGPGTYTLQDELRYNYGNAGAIIVDYRKGKQLNRKIWLSKDYYLDEVEDRLQREINYENNSVKSDFQHEYQFDDKGIWLQSLRYLPLGPGHVRDPKQFKIRTVTYWPDS